MLLKRDMRGYGFRGLNRIGDDDERYVVDPCVLVAVARVVRGEAQAVRAGHVGRECRCLDLDDAIGRVGGFVVEDDALALLATTRPRISICGDQGSDNMCAANFLQRSCRAVVDCVCVGGISHGIHNDVIMGLRRSALFQHVLIALILINVIHGPWGEYTHWMRLMQVVPSHKCPIL